MSTRHLMLLLVAIGFCGFAIWALVPKTKAQQSTNDPWKMGGPGKVIDQKARLANADDEDSVRLLTEEVFNHPHIGGRLPALAEKMVKDRLTKAEIHHLRGTRAGVQEQDVVNLVNLLASKLHAPDYAKTSLRQVRV